MDGLSLKAKESMSGRMDTSEEVKIEMDTEEMKLGSAGGLVKLCECQPDTPWTREEAENGPKVTNEISAFKGAPKDAESNKLLEHRQEQLRIDSLPLSEIQTTESNAEEQQMKKQFGEVAAEGSIEPQLSKVKPGRATEAKDLPAACSPTENATVSEEVQEKLESRRVQRLRRMELRRTSQKSSDGDQLSDDDSDTMVDDPSDVDFVPRATRRTNRVPSRNQRTLEAFPAVSQPSITATAGHMAIPRIQQLSSQKQKPFPVLPHCSPRQSVKMHCANCHNALQKGQTAYQRKGMPQLFCSSACLAAFARRPPRKKLCVYCKRDIGTVKETVFAQNGPSNSFQEFCNNVCLSRFETQSQRSSALVTELSGVRCSMCHLVGEILHEVSSGNMVHHLCSDTCFSHFRATKGLKTSCCDSCGLYIYAKTSRVEYLLHEGQQRRFCDAACLAQFKKKNTKVLPCQWCKTLSKNFDMLCRGDVHGKALLFCSLCCITSHKVKTSGETVPMQPCSFCLRELAEPAYYYTANRVIYQFCSPSCWTKFQKNTPDGDIHLSCHSCHNMFNGKPEILDWQDSIFQFCCKECCEDYKRLHGVVSVCEHCKQEKLLYEKIKFSGVEKNFCSEGCILLYKQDFTKNLGLCCITCTYCSQTCTRAVTEEMDGNTWDFCSEDCKSKYLLWYLKVARCHACKRQGKLLETIHWRGEIKHYCDQKCLLRFYSQQNQPNLDTQQGPESLLNSQSPDSKSPPAAVKKSEPTGRRHTAQPPPPPSSPPPAVTLLNKNKASLCRPVMEDRATSCSPEVKSQGCQTDDIPMAPPFVLPIPMPVYIPLPLHMYCRYAPVPLTLPLPVPVPMFFPTTLENADKIVEAIEEIKVKIPSNPLEADILAMAEMIAEASEMGKASSDLCDLVSNPSAESLLEDCDLFGPTRDDMLSMAVKMANVLDEPGPDLREDLPKDLNPSVEFLIDCGIVSPDSICTKNELPVAVKKGSKQLGLSESCSKDPPGARATRTRLNHTYGVNAWKVWAQSKNHVTEERKKKRFKVKEDILSCTAAELNYGLAQFVKETASPSGEYYEPDSVYYLCLGIQQYLLENHRMVNIFTDQYYATFVQELNKILSKWNPEISPEGLARSDVEEEHLWDCKQLGVYSPFVLINTLMYFNTKYFGLRTVEQHMELSFANVARQSRMVSVSEGVIKVHSVCYYPSWRHRKTKEAALGKRKRDDDIPGKEQEENRMNPLRCPVKFFEFYLSKCSGTVRNRSDVFYLQPEKSCVAESPLWYSAVPMDRATLETMLYRILAVREIYRDYTSKEHAI
ncbi:zinc finger MYM-type protein 3-like isoform X1 [Brienomyrus brachyistius]|uniref:zinc finger MYM-type protein 3-like isoform X1 n=1 Tax=Brienomyrus brachyistius TaxID=42636 RepID=UPI0020B40B93|nr:zinc finger MYM-type protein 3-like isoform X1 [Brienomyrus brachyistius]XP_048838845.1 zinc finger MYM-type protein 3-like isoform X1 [Brienomyrus brachyistius]XP_048838846.1 zinc finger MYM-type protein 3-like isoform X1 [Brienomyrus brachyistius]XP_048838847.1 zinc finger MYM-type protein 3-like isoform X1 [Brienomyrus brachyistius]